MFAASLPVSVSYLLNRCSPGSFFGQQNNRHVCYFKSEQLIKNPAKQFIPPQPQSAIRNQILQCFTFPTEPQPANKRAGYPDAISDRIILQTGTRA
ncbi:hypothetical protein [Burkholderia ubonensis]|uniref:hypothetical protein n=1 Tax=Burkholderia ubonensis TaxID=101571 RepID=UPI0012FA4FC9|nr:hypothetical protein [Burkholderia ubonensis]